MTPLVLRRAAARLLSFPRACTGYVSSHIGKNRGNPFLVCKENRAHSEHELTDTGWPFSRDACVTEGKNQMLQNRRTTALENFDKIKIII